MKCTAYVLLDRCKEPGYCIRFKKNITDASMGEDCIYYLKLKYEDGELLTPQQHLLMQDQDFRSKKMQGPMK